MRTGEELFYSCFLLGIGALGQARFTSHGPQFRRAFARALDEVKSDSAEAVGPVTADDMISFGMSSRMLSLEGPDLVVAFLRYGPEVARARLCELTTDSEWFLRGAEVFLLEMSLPPKMPLSSEIPLQVEEAAAVGSSDSWAPPRRGLTEISIPGDGFTDAVFIRTKSSAFLWSAMFGMRFVSIIIFIFTAGILSSFSVMDRGNFGLGWLTGAMLISSIAYGDKFWEIISYRLRAAK